MKWLFGFLVLLFGAQAYSQVAPTRQAFADAAGDPEGVPVEAFELSRDDLQIEVWAESPMIFSPVAMDVDARGRIWATEGIDYKQKARVAAGQSIIVLEDTDGDGRADSSHVFVTEPKMRPAPMGIAVFDNRIVLSATPEIIVYTDVDRDAVFDPGVDRREVFLEGFRNKTHDHTVHAVVGAPSGQWHFSFGNCGAQIETVDGRSYSANCYYGHPDGIGTVSSDGHTYVGGATMRINPDGTGLEVTAHNMRNPHDMAISAYGDIYQSDNDDPAHCRTSWVMEYGNMGYADLRDGSRSWEEVAKSWEEPAGWSRGRRYSSSHWRENYPGACPPGTVYGAGSPTGNALIEDGVLGLDGTFVHCCMVRKELMHSRPVLTGSHYQMQELEPLVKLKDSEKGQHFLPTDVVVGLDGSLYLSDFYNDTSRRTNQVSGTIYRISKKAQTSSPTKSQVAEIDYTTLAGQVAALSSPVGNVRSHAASLLVAQGEAAVAVVQPLLLSNRPELCARAIWVLAQLGDEGRGLVEPYLQNGEAVAIAAYRALRLADPDGLLERAAELASHDSAALRREVAVSLRDWGFAESEGVLAALASRYQAGDRYYLEALGIAFTGKEEAVYRQIIRPQIGAPAQWDRVAVDLAWRLHTQEAIADLEVYLREQRPDLETFRHVAMAFASFRSPEQRAENLARLESIASLDWAAGEDYQTTIREIIAKDLNELKGQKVDFTSEVPRQFGTPTVVSEPAAIAALVGDAKAGAVQTARCYMCHKVAGQGVAFGPDLTHWGSERTIEQIVREIVEPDAHLAHGYDTPVRVTTGAHTLEGLQSNYSHHAGSLKIKLMGGVTKKILFRRSGARVEPLKESLMPSAVEMGMTDQNIRDVAEYLKTLNRAEEPAPTSAQLVDSSGPEWIALGEEDFLNVNTYTDTWRWDGGHVYCTGRPTGVIRYREPLTDFEFTCEWMHKRKGGNSGIFLWGSSESIIERTTGVGRFPHGVEVQVLDLGYEEVYEKQFGKVGDWFTCHGDVFTVGPVQMRPFPPVGPRGKRSFPTAETTRGIYEWNHYHIRAVGGEVRLTVNGVEVSGGDQISPASGYLCLESEGAPVEFRNMKLRKLSPLSPDFEVVDIPVPVWEGPPSKGATQSETDLKDHAILGTWDYLDGYSREFRPDGMCILRNGSDIVWQRPTIKKSKDTVTLRGNLYHELKADGKLHIEGNYIAVQR